MEILTRAWIGFVDAVRANVRFLTQGFDTLPGDRNLVASELRELVERDMAILIHRRTKFTDEGGTLLDGWLAVLESFVARSLRPKLAGNSVIALWNDGALTHILDAMIANEQAALAKVPARVPVTGRFDSHWAV